jgi:integrase
VGTCGSASLAPVAFAINSSSTQDWMEEDAASRSETHPGPRKKAESRLAQMVADATRHQGATADHHTLAELWVEYEAAVLPTLSPNTARGYERSWRLYVKRPLGRHKLRDIDAQVLEKLYVRLAREGGRDRLGKSRPLQQQTVKHLHTLLGSKLSTAVRWRWITSPHAADLARTPSVPTEEVARAPESDIVRGALAAAEERSQQMHAFLRVSALAGTRPEEAAALRFNDLDLEFGTLRIDEAIVRDRDGRLIVAATKTHQVRELAIDFGTLKLLDALRTDDADDDTFIFRGDDGEPVAPNAWSQRWTRLRKHVPGASGVRLYDLRHWQGTESADKSNLAVTQHRLGHSRLSTTGRYAKARKPTDTAVANALAAELDHDS